MTKALHRLAPTVGSLEGVTLLLFPSSSFGDWFFVIIAFFFPFVKGLKEKEYEL